MASYYYLVATLPSLRYDGTVPFSCSQFLSLCKEQVSERHYQIIRAAVQDGDAKNKFLSDYQHFCSMVKGELTEQRSRKLSVSDSEYKNTSDKEARISETVRQALGMDDVLQAELLLLQLHWKYVDDLVALHTFDIEGLLAYALKLRLLERKNLFTREEGNAEFKRLFSNIQTEIENN